MEYGRMPFPAAWFKSHHVGPPEDKDPILPLAPTRKSVSLFGAANLWNGKLVTQFEKKFNAMMFRYFLCLLLQHQRRARKMVILLDNTE
jgi:hypothetical protein